MIRFAILGAGLAALLWRSFGWLLGLLAWMLIGWLSDAMYANGLWPIGAGLRIVALVLLVGLLFGLLALVYQACMTMYLVMRGTD